MAVSTGERRRKIDGREYDTPLPIPCTLKELDVLLDKWISNKVFKLNQISREPTEEERRDPHLCRLHNYVQHPTIECWALHRLQDQRRDSRTILARSSKKPTPKPQREGCSSGSNLCRSRGGRRGESSPAYRSNYHLIAKLQVQKFVRLVGTYDKGEKDSHKGFGEHCLQGRSRMFISGSHRWQSSLIGINWNHF